MADSTPSYRNRAYIQDKDSKISEAFDDVLSQISSIQRQTNSDPTGNTPPPPTPGSLTVTAAHGIFDAAIQDNTSPIKRGAQYFLQYSTTPSFDAPVTVSLGPSRNWRGSLGNQKLYWRAHSSYPTSAKSGHVYHGTSVQPTAVQGGGVLTGPQLQPSQGTGTSVGADGSDGGFGNQPSRGGTQ